MRKSYDFSKGIKNPYLEKCWKKYRGDNKCCCNCRYQMDLHSHPWVNGKSIMDKVGYICSYPMTGRKVVLSNKHGLCELWTSDWYKLTKKMNEGDIELLGKSQKTGNLKVKCVNNILYIGKKLIDIKYVKNLYKAWRYV